VVDGSRRVSKNVASPTLEAERTVVHFTVSVERTTVTDTSGFDHVTRMDPQSWTMADAARMVFVQTPAGQASQTLENELRYECPPFGGCARQARALRLIEHVVVPLGVVPQHVT